MQKDDKASVNGRSNDITADELLLLLNESIREKPEKDKKQKKDFSIKKDGASLEIDDSVYESARKEVRRTPVMMGEDDSELDVDELIEKFITEPKRQREREKAEAKIKAEEEIKVQTESEVAVGSAVETVSEAVAEAVVEAEVETETETEAVAEAEAEACTEAEPVEEAKESFENGNESDLNDDAYAETLALMEQLKAPVNEVNVISDEETVSLEGEVFEEAYADDDDVKIAGDADLPLFAADTASDVESSDVDTAVMSEKTAVFDIALVKELMEQGTELEENDSVLSRTEVFTPVHEDEITDIVPVNMTEEEQTEPVEAAVDAVADTVDESDPEVVTTDIQIEEAIDRTDMDLMIALGMEEELVDAVGEQQAAAISDDIIQKHEETAQMKASVAMGEFNSFEQVKDILTSYMHRYYFLIARIATAVLVLGALFVVENYTMFGISLPEFARPTSYPVVYAMIDLQLVFISCALTGKQLFDGVKGMITFKPTAECLMPFVMLLSILYTAIVCFVAPVGDFKLYNLPIALTALFALFYEFLGLKRDIFSFNVIATAKKKFVISPVSLETEVLEREAFEEFVPAESEIVRVVKTDFVDGFFRRISGTKVVKPSVGLAIPIVVILSVAFAVLNFMGSDSLYSSVTMAFMAAMFTVPAVSFVIYSYPFYKSSKDSYENHSAVIGESSLTEYSSSAVISFEDKEVFPSAGVKVTSIKVYGNNRIDEIIYKLSSAFIKVGGPLADVLKQATHELGHSEDVELLEVEDDGFAVSVDNIQTFIGKSTYMEKHDYDPPYDHEGRRQEQEGAIGVLYVAYGGQLAAKVYVRYNIDYEFEKILAHLNRTGLCVGIKSFDPNIDDVLLSKKIKTAKYPIKVIRSRNVEDIPHSVERCDSGIVSTGSVKSLLRTVALCERVGGVIKTGLIVKVLSMLIGVVVMSLIYAFGDIMSVSSLYIALYQLFWAVPVLLISKFLV